LVAQNGHLKGNKASLDLYTVPLSSIFDLVLVFHCIWVLIICKLAYECVFGESSTFERWN